MQISSKTKGLGQKLTGVHLFSKSQGIRRKKNFVSISLWSKVTGKNMSKVEKDEKLKNRSKKYELSKVKYEWKWVRISEKATIWYDSWSGTISKDVYQVLVRLTFWPLYNKLLYNVVFEWISQNTRQTNTSLDMIWPITDEL